MRAREFLMEGGNAFSGKTRSISVQEIFGEQGLKEKGIKFLGRDDDGEIIPVPPGYGTIGVLAAATGLSTEYIMNHFMGSVGKKPISGDMDLAIDVKQFGTDFQARMLEKLQNSFGKENVKQKAGNCIFVPTPISTIGSPMVKGSDAEYVQVDLVFGNANILKFMWHSPSVEESKYKGVFRTIFLMRIVSGLRELEGRHWVKYDGDTLVAYSGPSLALERGLMWGYKHKINKKDPTKFNATDNSVKDFDEYFNIVKAKWPETTMEELKKGYIETDNPEEIATYIFGPGTKPEDLNSFESVYKIFMASRLYTPEFKMKILKDVKETFEKSYPGLEMPDELQNI